MFTNVTTTCACNVTTKNTGRRRLINGQTVEDKSGVADAVVMLTSTGEDFAGTFTLASKFSFNSVTDIRKVMIVIIMFLTLWGVGMALVFTCVLRRGAAISLSAKHNEELENAKNAVGRDHSAQAVTDRLKHCVKQLFPSTFSNKPMLFRLVDEVIKHHAYMVFFRVNGKQDAEARIVIGVRILTVQTMLMFLLAVFHDIQGPDDDGSCTGLKSPVSCLQRTSYLDAKLTYCQWTIMNAATEVDDIRSPAGSCSYREPNFTWQVIVIAIMLVAIATAIVNVPINFLFDFLTAPLADPIKVLVHVTSKAISYLVSLPDPFSLSHEQVGEVDSIVTRSLATQMSSAATTATTAARNAGRRASAAAISALSHASTAMGITARRTKVAGADVRIIPTSAKDAKELASVSFSSIIVRATRLEDEADQERLQYYVSQKTKHSQSLPPLDRSDDQDLTPPTNAGSYSRQTSTLPKCQNVSTDFERLALDIARQRQLLRDREMEEFDKCWGLNRSGDFANVYVPGRGIGTKSEEVIKHEIAFVKEQTACKIAKLNFSDDDDIGLEILHLFVLDLLGRDTNAAKIFMSKTSASS